MKNDPTPLVAYALPLLAALPFAAPVRADSVVKTLPSGGAKQLLENPHEKVSQDEGVGAIEMKNDCVAKDGKKLRKGDRAYEQCLKDRLENAHK